ncbi:hypothetical protein GE09DRAFT_1167362 [Coniochaeta sp. 2T2.1]|nr:hypothetical protein GE09DRAFT_1167362 [Coniochaeta sp. 2T2.1]
MGSSRIAPSNAVSYVALPENPDTPSAPSPAGSAKKRASSPALGSPTSNKRTRRQAVKTDLNYAESSDDDAALIPDHDFDDDLVLPSDPKSDDEPLLSPTSTKTRKASPKAARATSRKTIRMATARKIQKRRAPTGRVPKLSFIKTSRKTNTHMTNVSVQYVDNITPPVIPPWATLPYHVLLRIFEFAAGTPITAGVGKWLIDASTVCHTFTEPALTALYRQPPLLTLQMAHGLVDLISKSPLEMTFNYRQKIRCLDIDAGVIASKAFRGQHLDFKALFGNAPGLTEVYIWHEKDQAPYRDIDKNIRWSYPANMFLALGIGFQNGGAREGDVSLVPAPASGSIPRLEGWMWSRRMLGGLPLNKLIDAHKFAAFQGLRKLAFMNFQLPSLNSKNPEEPETVQADGEYIAHLAQSIRVLPDLRHLVLECSTAVTGTLLSSLPKSIEHLELTNCWEIKADHMVEYLQSHGNALRHLTLNHNQSLSLAFLPVLGKACPRLETLRMNLTYYKIHFSYNDSDPAYDALLTADQVPTWPTTLRHLDLKNLRKWDKAAAEVFFQSLLDSASNLPKLRHIEIKAMLDIPFRERSSLRDKWEAHLKRVYLRKCVDPLPNAAPPATPKGALKKNHDAAKPDTPSPRRSGRIATHPSGPSSRASSTGRETRGRSGWPSYAEPDTDEDLEVEESFDDEDEDEKLDNAQHSKDAAEQQAETFVQGLCNVVDIRFDNQKPVEHQFRMEDFLDDESNDPTDEEWDGAHESDDGNYAW